MALVQILARQPRDPGEYTSSTITIPAGLDLMRCVVFLTQDSDFADPAQTITIIAEVSTDGGANWREHFRGKWIGETPAPTLYGGWAFVLSGISAYAGGLARGRIIQEGTIRYGVRGEIR